MTPCGPVYGYEHFSGIYCLCCQGHTEYGQGLGELHRKSGRGQTKEYKLMGDIAISKPMGVGPQGEAECCEVAGVFTRLHDMDATRQQ